METKELYDAGSGADHPDDRGGEFAIAVFNGAAIRETGVKSRYAFERNPTTKEIFTYKNLKEACDAADEHYRQPHATGVNFFVVEIQ